MPSVTRRFTILGCASSPGVPRITGDWGACDPSNPRNRRTRAAFLIEQITEDGGRTTVAVDTGPDFREQMIAARVEEIDAVVYTHAHADHIHGIDDLRGFALTQRRQIPIFADGATMERLKQAFSYCFETPPGSSYPPIITAHDIVLDADGIGQTIVVEGRGGPLALQPLRQVHGDIHSLGFRVGDVAYCCDVSDFPEATVAGLGGLDTLIIDALQYRPHPSHLSLAQALAWIERLKPKSAILTHMHTPLDYERVLRETPDHVTPAHDQMWIEREVEI